MHAVDHQPYGAEGLQPRICSATRCIDEASQYGAGMFSMRSLAFRLSHSLLLPDHDFQSRAAFISCFMAFAVDYVHSVNTPELT